MSRILVGVDGTERGLRAAKWALARAKRDASDVTLMVVADGILANQSGLTKETLEKAIENALDEKIGQIAGDYPGLRISKRVATGYVVDEIVDASVEYDLVVVGSHHGRSISEAIGGAKGLLISTHSQAPTVIVPADWDESAQGEGIVVGVGPKDHVFPAHLTFAAEEAKVTGEAVHIVGSWGTSPVLEMTAAFLGSNQKPLGDIRERELAEQVEQLREKYPDAQISCSCVENPSPAHVLIDAAKDSRLLILGADVRNVVQRTIFGGVAHSVLLKLDVPTIIVPQAKTK